MYAYLKRCVSDQDYARFTLFFIRQRSDFHRQFALHDVLSRILESITYSHIVLICDAKDEELGWAQYWYMTKDGEPHPKGEVAFIDSVLIDKQNRSTRVFFLGFRDLLKQIAEENSRIKYVRFCAQADNVYVNRLYTKFAKIIGQREGDLGMDNIYSTDFERLLHYLNRENRERR